MTQRISQNILFITELNLPSQLFVDYICQETGIEAVAVNPRESFEIFDSVQSLVLLDVDYVNEACISLWSGRAIDYPGIVLSAFNLRDEDHALELLLKANFNGVFYRYDSLPLICKGITSLLEGSLWFSRPLMSRLIGYYRRQQINNYCLKYGLTRRELEVIGLLRVGVSNSEMAGHLFISEYTVKSHLYNIYRKIKVRNRVQAINWARQHPSILPARYPNR